MRKGLVLEGGALRGLFTMGILDTFMENGITFDGTVGVSAGVAFGVNFKSKQSGRVLRYSKRFNRDWHFKSWRSLILTGDLFGAEFCYDTIPNELDVFDAETFSSDPMDFWAVATDCDSGKAEYHKLDKGLAEDMLWTRASASMPIASRPVKIGDRRYLDGGLSDSIPLEFMEKQGYEKNVVILTQPKDYVKLSYPSAMKIPLLHLPKIARLLEDRPALYNAQTAYVKVREEEGKALVFYPPVPLDIGALERSPEEMQRVYDCGREEAVRRLEEVMEFLT